MSVCRLCVYVHMHVSMKGLVRTGVGGYSKHQSGRCSLSDAVDLLQPAFLPDLAKGRRRICVILRVRCLSDINKPRFVLLLAVGPTS